MDTAEPEWEALVDGGVVDRYQRDGQVMRVHLAAMASEEPLRFTYRMQASYPLSVWTPPSRAYLAGDPLRATVRAPVRIEVK
jgi:hypothetical protein